MVTSNSYTFDMSLDNMIIEAYERIGIAGSQLTAQHAISAKNSLNLMFSDWNNRGVNLWMRQKFMQTLNWNQNTYSLPQGTVEILEMLYVQINRVLNGTAFASSGIAQNAFDGNPATACTQNSINGNIGYNFGAGQQQAIKYIGIQSNANLNYTLTIQYSYDGTNWINAIVSPQSSAYIAGQIQWICNPIPVAAQYWRILETGGATLNIQELYFAIDNTSRVIGAIGIADYEAISNKTNYGTPTSYAMNKQINPYFYIYPTPSNNVNQYLVYNVERQIQDVNLLTQTTYIPNRFQEACVSNLALKLALKFAPEKYESLKPQALDAFIAASKEDEENVDLILSFNYNSFGY